VASGNTKAYSQAADMLRIGGTLCGIGILLGKSYIETHVAGIVQGLKIVGIVGSMKETLEAVELVRQGEVKAHVQVREFRKLPVVYEMLQKGDINGRVVLRVGGE